MPACEDLVRAGINSQTLLAAEKKGFVDYLRQGDVAAVFYLGRDTMATEGRVVNAISQVGHRADGALRRDFPPVLHGADPSRVVITPIRQDALAVWT